MVTTRKPEEVLTALQFQLSTNPIRFWELTQEDGSLAASFGDKTPGAPAPTGEDALEKLGEAFAYLPPGTYTFTGKHYAGNGQHNQFRFRVQLHMEAAPQHPAPYAQPQPYPYGPGGYEPGYGPVRIQGAEQDEDDGHAGQLILDLTREVEQLKAKLDKQELEFRLRQLEEQVANPREKELDLAGIAGIAQALAPIFLGRQAPVSALAGPPDGYVDSPMPSPASAYAHTVPAPGVAPQPAAAAPLATAPAAEDLPEAGPELPMLTEPEYEFVIHHMDILLRNLGKERVLAALPRIAQLSPHKFELMAALAN